MAEASQNRRWRGGCACCAWAVSSSWRDAVRRTTKRMRIERVYDIIDRKWDPQFGTKANYRISDVPPGPNDIQIENAVPASGVVTLPYALALATAHNREYQTQKELLYTTALDLRLVRHGYETQLSAAAAFYSHALTRRHGRTSDDCPDGGQCRLQPAAGHRHPGRHEGRRRPGPTSSPGEGRRG